MTSENTNNPPVKNDHQNTDKPQTNKHVSPKNWDERIIDGLEANWKPIAGVLCLALLVFGAFSIFSSIQKSNNKKVWNEYYAIEAQLQKMDKPLTADKKGPDIQKLEELRMSFSDFAKKNPNSPASLYGATRLSAKYIENKDLNTASEILNSVKISKLNGFVPALYHMQKANVQMGLKKWDEALIALKALTDKKEYSSFAPEALLQKGLIYMEKNDFAKAKDSFNKIKTDFSDAGVSKEADSYLRWMQVSKK